MVKIVVPITFEQTETGTMELQLLLELKCEPDKIPDLINKIKGLLNE